MASSFFALLDDIAALTKLAATKTLPVLGDDLAVNAEKLSGGLKPERELPVVYAVFKWSLINKVAVIALALVMSAFLPQAIPYMLIAGALYLLFEGGSALYSAIFRPSEEAQNTARLEGALLDESVDMVVFEREKIRGAIITDLVLSAEIIVIALGALSGQTLLMQMMTLTAIGVGMTVGVYGLVALIVKLDDMGLALQKDVRKNAAAAVKRAAGRGLLHLAVWVMKLLPIVGVVAMFMVGSDILMHEIQWLHHAYLSVEKVVIAASGVGVGAVLVWALKTGAGALFGLVMGATEKLIMRCSH